MLARMKMLESDTEVLQSIIARQERLRQIELKKPVRTLGLPSGQRQVTDLNEPLDHGRR